MKTKHLSTVDDASQELGLSPNALYLLLNGEKGHGTPPHYRIGGKIMVDVNEVLEWAKEGGTARTKKKSDA